MADSKWFADMFVFRSDFSLGICVILMLGCSNSATKKEKRAQVKAEKVEQNASLMGKINSLGASLYRELLGTYGLDQNIDLQLSRGPQKNTFYERSSFVAAQNGTSLKLSTDPSEIIEYRKIGSKMFLSTKNGPFHLSDEQNLRFETKQRDIFEAPKYFLGLFGRRVFFERRDDALISGRPTEIYQLVLLKPQNKLEKKGFVQLSGEDSQDLEPLNTSEKTKSYGLLGKSTPLQVSGSLMLDKASGLPVHIEILGSFAIMSPSGPVTAELAFSNKVRNIGLGKPIKTPALETLRQERKKVPGDAEQVLKNLIH